MARQAGHRRRPLRAAPKESTLEVFATLDELRDKVPPELFDMVARAARQPTVEELDI